MLSLAMAVPPFGVLERRVRPADRLTGKRQVWDTKSGRRSGKAAIA